MVADRCTTVITITTCITLTIIRIIRWWVLQRIIMLYSSSSNSSTISTIIPYRLEASPERTINSHTSHTRWRWVLEVFRDRYPHRSHNSPTASGRPQTTSSNRLVCRLTAECSSSIKLDLWVLNTAH